jgi:hypothetical protein
MATNKLVLRTVQEFMADYVPVYQPLYPLFLGKSQSWSEEVGKIDFKRLNAIGDIRAKHVTPKDTEIRQVSVNEGTKSFKKYFLANQFTQSNLQDTQQNEDVIKQVLDEHQKQADELMMFGEGTSALSDVVNNGLFWSNDPNYDLESSTGITGSDPLIDLHASVMANALVADQVAGRKVIIFYGSAITPLFDGVYAANPVPFKRVLAETLGANYSLMKMPAGLTTQSSSGWIIANLDQVKLHYTALPKLADQGVNSEKMYSWHNFLMGSMMMEVMAKNAIIHQPATVS